MFCKLAVGNVRKSMKDYTIYFLTLMFGVCLFYVFNSMDAQQEMLVISDSQRKILETFNGVIEGISVFISVILGFLIIYANKFLIKRRKKELGLYMILGMERGKISRILMFETLLIGVFALGLGLIAGVFGSQGFSVLTAKMMETSIKRFYFVFSIGACMKAIIYFGIIFLVVMIFNISMISSCKLIDLLQGDKRNEKLHIKKLWVSVVLFIIAVICLLLAYYFIIKNGMQEIDIVFGAAITFGIIGTLLFFMSLSGFLLRIIKSKRTVYYRGLNMFILRQINSKINMTYLSMTIICLMLLVTIGMLSSGMGISSALTGDMEATTPYDVSFTFWELEGMEEKSMKEVLIKAGFPYDKLVGDQVEIPFYFDDITYDTIMSKQTTDKNIKSFIESGLHERVMMIRLSDYNKARQLQGIEPIVLKENEYVINCNYDAIKPQFVEKDNKGREKIRKNIITIDVRDYHAADLPLQSICYQTSSSLYDVGTLILPDKALAGKETEQILLSINYKEYSENYEAMFQKANKKLSQEKEINHYMSVSRIEVFEQGVGLRTIVTFFVLYIGIIFLITSAAVLALQQLSESSDNIERYQLLRKIGVENRMMNRSLFVQIFIYFMMPLSLAIVHSIVGIYVANQVISIFGEMNVLKNIVFAGIFILLIYGGYFYATYAGSKNIIKAKK